MLEVCAGEECRGRIPSCATCTDAASVLPPHVLPVPQELRDHVIIAGYGRAGQLIGQLLSENLIPFVALDVSNERVATGKAQVSASAAL